MKWNKLLFLALFLQIIGCKTVKYGLSGINIPPNIKTVSIALFDNKATLVNPLLSQVITEKLKDKFIRQTSLKLITADGDWQFKGNIVLYSVEPVNRQTVQGGTSNRLKIDLAVNFINVLDEKENFEKTFSRFADFEASKNFASIESGLIDEITNQLVTDVFNETALKW